MENQTSNQIKTPVKPIEVVKSPIDIGHDKLLEALFFFWDGFERASMDFFLVRDTARQVMADQPLKGDRLTLGIRRMEWQGGQQRVFKAYMEHEKTLPKASSTLNTLVFQYKDVPVYLYIYDENPTIQTLNIVFYGNETFNVPTPFDEFSEKYDK